MILNDKYAIDRTERDSFRDVGSPVDSRRNEIDIVRDLLSGSNTRIGYDPAFESLISVTPATDYLGSLEFGKGYDLTRSRPTDEPALKAALHDSTKMYASSQN